MAIKKKVLSVFTLSMINMAAIIGIKNLPTLAVYKLNRAWRYVGNSGKIKSWGGTGSLNGGLKLPSTHAVVIIGKHTEPPKKKTWYRWNPKKTVWYDIENSWGPSWGRDGFAQILDKVHNVQCRNTFIII